MSELERLAAEIDSMKAAMEQQSAALEEGQLYGPTEIPGDEPNGAGGDCPRLEDFEADGDGEQDYGEPARAGDQPRPLLDPSPGRNDTSPLSASEVDLWG